MPEGPSDVAGGLKSGDIILKIGQSEGNFVDVSGMSLLKIVRLLKGPKGTDVLLEVRPSKEPSETKRITIVRDRIDSNKANLLIWDQVVGSDMSRTTHKPANAVSYKQSYAQSLIEPTFRQQFIYNGKVGSNLKFLYREISNNYARAPFSQEVQYDLNE